MTNKQLNAQFNIPEWVKGDTPAEEAKAIQKRFADRQDKASVETMEELLQAVADKQEYYKMQQGLANEATQVPDMMDGQTPEGMEQFTQQAPQQGMQQMRFGGVGHAQDMSGNDITFGADELAGGAGIPSAGGMAGMATTAMDFGQQIFGKTGIDTSGLSAAPEVDSTGGAMAGGALKGASAGMALGPWGAAIGGVIGAGAGLIGNSKQKKDAQKADYNNALVTNSSMAYGGYSKNQYAGGGPLNPGGAVDNSLSNLFDNLTQTPQTAVGNAGRLPTGESTAPNQVIAPPPAIEGGNHVWGKDPMTKPSFKDTRVGKAAGNTANWVGNNYGSLMNLAPIVGNLTNKIERGTDPRRDRADLQYKPNYVDERQLQRVAQEEHGALTNQLRDASGGSGARFSANALAAGLNKTKGLSAAYMGAQAQNSQENTKQFQSRAQNQSLNLRQSNLDVQDKMLGDAAVETAKSERRAAIFEDIGKVGMEEGNKKLVKEMFGYTWDGRYYRDNSGKIVPRTAKEKEAATKEEGKGKKVDSNKSMFSPYGFGAKKNIT